MALHLVEAPGRRPPTIDPGGPLRWKTGRTGAIRSAAGESGAPASASRAGVSRKWMRGLRLSGFHCSQGLRVGSAAGVRVTFGEGAVGTRLDAATAGRLFCGGGGRGAWREGMGGPGGG